MNKNLLVNINSSLKIAMRKMNLTGERCLIVINKNNYLKGTLSDGDVRRAILNKFKLTKPIESIVNKKPFVIEKSDLKNIKKFENKIKQFFIIPVVDKNYLVDIIKYENIKKQKNIKSNILKNVPIIVMAGGKGERLKPFTNILPKPLIPINNKTLIERIIENFFSSGAKKFYFTLNYKQRIIEAFFNDIKTLYKYKFFREKKFLGTAGSLKQFSQLNKTVIITNCDTILKIDFKDLLKFHKSSNLDFTVIAASVEHKIPYGECVISKDGFLEKIREKPKYNFLINTGIYVSNSRVFKLIKKNEKIDMNIFIKRLKSKNKKIGIYPVPSNSWQDVGQWKEYWDVIKRL